MNAEQLWQQSDVTRAWPTASVQALAAQTQHWHLTAGEALPRDLALLGVLHGEVLVQAPNGVPQMLPGGSVLTHFATGLELHAGARGAWVAGVCGQLPQTVHTPRPRHLAAAPLRPPVEPSAELGPTPTPAGPAAIPAAPRPTLMAGWLAPLLPPGPVWRDRLRALRHLGRGNWGAIAVAVLCLQILALGLPLFVKFLVDHSIIQGDSPHWTTGIAFVLAAALLSMALQIATHGLLLGSDTRRTDTDLATARACAAVLQAGSTLSYPLLLIYLAPAAAGVLLVGAAAQAWLMYLVAPWQARLSLVGTSPASPTQMRSVLQHAATVVSWGPNALAAVATRLARSSADTWETALEQVHRFDATGHVIAYVAQSLLLGLGSLWVLGHSTSPGTYVAALLMGHHLQSSWRALHSRAQDLPRSTWLAPRHQLTEAPEWDGTLTAVEVRHPGVRSVSLTLQQGTRTGLVGPAGAGKSALASLCAGRILAAHGRLEPAGWEAHTAYLQAEAPWSAGVLRDLLALHREVDRPTLLRALEQACISDWVEHLPQHVHTQLADDDPRLCHSARVRLNIAQTLLGQPRLWVIDGALDACEPALADALLTHMAQALPHTTLLLVTQDPLLLQRCHNILIMQQGQVHAEGTFEALSAQGLLQPWVLHA